jgi:hypothetical protein
MDAEQAFLCIVGVVLLACFIQILPAVILFFMLKTLGEVFARIHEYAAAVE